MRTFSVLCKGFVPWAHDRNIASAPRGEMKSLDLNENIEFISFRMSSARARTQIGLKSVGAKTLSYYMFRKDRC